MTRLFGLRLPALLVALGFAAAACSAADDDGAGVRDLGESESAGSSASASSPASSSVADGDEVAEGTTSDGGYEYASNVDSHRLVVADLCEIGEALDAGDFDAAATIYRDGINSVNADGSVRTIAGFASLDDREHGLDVFYGTPTPLDDFVSSALDGSGSFEGQSDAVRAQGVEKGMQNQIMVAWVVHELASAMSKAAEGDFDVAEGAVHNWDEGWAFYHGSQPGCGPYGTADKRAADFGTTGTGDTALANEAILGAMNNGRDALLTEDAATAEIAVAEVKRNLVIIYSQAAVRYANLIEDDSADEETESAKVHQAEGLAFWRVIEALVVPEGADGDAINAIFDLANEPGANGHGDEVRAALQPAWDAIGITGDDIGVLG